MIYTRINESTVSEAKKIIQAGHTNLNLSNEKLDRIARIVAIQEAVSSNTFSYLGNNNGNSRYINENAPATPQNTIGNGNPAYPQTNVGSQGFHSNDYQKGSGETSYTTLQIATQVAAATVGMDIVNTIPIDAPWCMLQYVEPVYGNGTLGGSGEGSENKPKYVQIKSDEIGRKDFNTAFNALDTNQWIYFYGSGLALKGLYQSLSIVDGSVIVEVVSVGTYDGVTFVYTPNSTNQIADVFANEVDVTIAEAGSLGSGGNTIDDAVKILLTNAKVDLVTAITEHIPGFSNFFNGSEEPMTREQNQTGVGNSLGIRMSSKHVETMSYEVTFQLTRTMMQDMPREGVDPVGLLAKAAQNQLIQSINDLILKRVRRLGVTHAAYLKNNEGFDNNLYIGNVTDTTIDLANIPTVGEFIDVRGIDRKSEFTGIINRFQRTNSGETSMSIASLLAVSIMKAAQRIGQENRIAAGNFAVVNSSMGMALQAIQTFQTIKFDTNISSTVTDKLHYLGNLAGVNIYVNPKQLGSDNTITVGRKGEINEAGVYFMPYIMSDMVTMVSEGTFSFRGLLNSRFALVDAGWYPEKNYLTYVVYAPYEYILS